MMRADQRLACFAMRSAQQCTYLGQINISGQATKLAKRPEMWI
jgi:hypothetical protein